MPVTPDLPSDAGQETIVPADDVREIVTQVLVGKGMFRAEAEIGAARMLEADLRGIHSHGSRALKRYLEYIDLGSIDPRARVLTETETPAIAVLDAGRGLGHVAATQAMNMAIDKAREVGTGTVAIRNGQHLGAASVYVLLAIDAGMVGFCTTNTAGASVAAYGSRQAATANNALAWGVPSQSGAPFVLDMACAAASWGKVETLGMYDRPIPADWALDEHGEPTTDAHAAKTLLPAAGARGYGLAHLCSILAGPLVGGKTPLHKTRSPAVEGSEHFFYVIDLTKFVEPDRFYDELDSTAQSIRALAPAEGFDQVRLPGELEHERACRWRAEGIPLHADHAAFLRELASGVKMDVAW